MGKSCAIFPVIYKAKNRLFGKCRIQICFGGLGSKVLGCAKFINLWRFAQFKCKRLGSKDKSQSIPCLLNLFLSFPGSFYMHPCKQTYKIIGIRSASLAETCWFVYPTLKCSTLSELLFGLFRSRVSKMFPWGTTSPFSFRHNIWQDAKTCLPDLLENISFRTTAQQSILFSIALPILANYKEQKLDYSETPVTDPFNFKENTKDGKLMLEKFVDVMLVNTPPGKKALTPFSQSAMYVFLYYVFY